MIEKFPVLKGNLDISEKTELKLRNAVNNIANRWFISSNVIITDFMSSCFKGCN